MVPKLTPFILRYSCPEGFVFETLELLQSGVEQSELELTCESFADWSPQVKPKCIRKLDWPLLKCQTC